jgi:hypothetical protein
VTKLYSAPYKYSKNTISEITPNDPTDKDDKSTIYIDDLLFIVYGPIPSGDTVTCDKSLF